MLIFCEQQQFYFFIALFSTDIFCLHRAPFAKLIKYFLTFFSCKAVGGEHECGQQIAEQAEQREHKKDALKRSFALNRTHRFSRRVRECALITHFV